MWLCLWVLWTALFLGLLVPICAVGRRVGRVLILAVTSAVKPFGVDACGSRFGVLAIDGQAVDLPLCIVFRYDEWRSTPSRGLVHRMLGRFAVAIGQSSHDKGTLRSAEPAGVEQCGSGRSANHVGV